jgi:Uma2 family endonuclease
MAMPLAVPRYTIDDLESFPDDGNRYELVDGILLVTPAPLPPHEVVVTRIYEALTTYLRLDRRAYVFTRGSVEVAPDVHLEPDILVVPVTEPMTGRWADVRAWWLAVEVSGGGSRIYDREYKRPAYLRAGVREVWRVDLAERCILVARPDAPDERRYPTQLCWHPPEMPAPLTLDVASVFEGVQGDW